ncbi:response regulator [Novosphingobium sp. FSY-8]|uniref:histidine kinase n=1 Tax=Novosphingobium ovatum TaxID=1908523 RepID=A0ABW9XF05_9SPHN|nr:response regulator [Novosphingobium ovatum]NBC37117.1 response regulator [Novosphingobium ovatum]
MLRKLIPGAGQPTFRTKLTEMTLLVTALALVLSGMGLIAVQYSYERARADRSFRQLADVLATNLSAAVVFGDTAAADGLVRSAQNVSDIVWVDVDGPNNKHVASYLAKGMTEREQRAAAQAAVAPGQSYSAVSLSEFGYHRVPVMVDGRSVGTLVLGYRYRSVGAITRENLPVAVVLLALCMSIAVAISTRMKRMLFRPLDQLKQTMAGVRRSGDLGARMALSNDPDFDDMITAFNRMLDEIENHNQKLTGAMSELEEARDAAQSASVAKSEFLANMSHELRTPLNAIIGYAEVLREDLARAGITRSLEDVGWICSSSQQLLELINSLLDLSKIEAGRMELDLHAYDLRKMLGEVEALLVPLAAKQGNTLSMRIDPAIDTVFGDSTKLRQCLLNLGSNACKFTKAGFVEVQARPEGHDLVFQVSDTGIGMSEADIARLFQPFTQSDASTTRRFGGTGLGLALVDRFAKMMGGAIEVTSEPGFGSVFTMRIPAHMNMTEGDDMAAQAAALGEGLPVAATPVDSPAAVAPRVRPLAVVIEDEPSSVELLRRMLERAGYDVELAADGQVGLDLARRVRPDLILLDLTLPTLDGWSVLERLQADAQLAQVPTVIVSVDDRKRISLEKGASDHLVKPVKVDELEAILQLYAARQSGTILLVEDDDATAALYENGLRQAGFAVVRASGGDEAENHLRQRQFAMVITDLKMRDGDGFALIRAMHDMPEDARPPVMVVTGRTLSGWEREILSARTQAVVPKAGLSPRSLVSSVTEVLDVA